LGTITLFSSFAAISDLNANVAAVNRSDLDVLLNTISSDTYYGYTDWRNDLTTRIHIAGSNPSSVLKSATGAILGIGNELIQGTINTGILLGEGIGKLTGDTGNNASARWLEEQLRYIENTSIQSAAFITGDQDGYVGSGYTAGYSAAVLTELVFAGKGIVNLGRSLPELAGSVGNKLDDAVKSFKNFELPGSQGGYLPAGTKINTEVLSIQANASKKIVSQMSKRGWTTGLINKTISKPKAIRQALNKATGNKATAYFDQSGSYIVVDNVTKDIIQISDRTRPWVPDSTIINPYLP
jgi:hypothetical protein